MAVGFGLAAILSVILLGDESGYEVGDVQKTKLAAIEAEWETEPPPAAFTVVGFPDNAAQETHDAIKVPYLLGLIATRSLDTPVTGLKDLIHQHEQRIRSGMIAYEYLERLRGGKDTDGNRAIFDDHKQDLGYGLLLKAYTPNPALATEEQIKQAAQGLDPGGRPGILGLPRHGRRRGLDAVADRAGLLLQRQARDRAQALAVAALPLQHPGALDGRRNRLVRRRIRTPALGRRRGPADLLSPPPA